MENKQEVILALLRSMLKLMKKLTYFSRVSNKGEYWSLINDVHIKLGNFEDVFLKKDTKKDEEKKQ